MSILTLFALVLLVMGIGVGFVLPRTIHKYYNVIDDEGSYELYEGHKILITYTKSFGYPMWIEYVDGERVSYTGTSFEYALEDVKDIVRCINRGEWK